MRPSRKVAFLGLGGLAILAAGVALGVIFVGGSGAPVLPTTGAYAPISVPTPLIPHLNMAGALAADPDSEIRSGQDLQATISAGSRAHEYKLTITNISGIGYINAFHWFPPQGVTIVKVVGSSAGHCAVSGVPGYGGSLFQKVVLNPDIICDGVNLRPPSCTCNGDGGSVAISFLANAFPSLGGAVRVDSATPVLNIIPSSPVQTPAPDEAVCKPGQKSTSAAPCVSSSSGP
jgi:hypothetical protein